MTPLWGLVPQSDNNRQSPLSYENPADDGDVVSLIPVSHILTDVVDNLQADGLRHDTKAIDITSSIAFTLQQSAPWLFGSHQCGRGAVSNPEAVNQLSIPGDE